MDCLDTKHTAMSETDKFSSFEGPWGEGKMSN